MAIAVSGPWNASGTALLNTLVQTHSDLGSKRALKIKAFETYSKIPQILQVTKESLRLIQDDIKMWNLIFIRLGYLRIQFLLERLSAERGGESRQNLVDVAREIVDMIVFLWLERDRYGHCHYDYDYIVR